MQYDARGATVTHQSSIPELRAALKDQLLATGFDVVGFAAPHGVLGEPGRRFTAAAASKEYEVMGWLTRTAEARIDPYVHTPWAQSVVMVAAAYGGDPHSETPQPFARYARLPDYHDWIRTRLEEVGNWLQVAAPRSRHEVMVDSGPIAEKLFAAASGVGWIGRNTLVINPEFGSWMVLGTLVTDIEFEPDRPVYGSCRACRRCVEACPTAAIHPKGGLNPRRCLSYLTVEAPNRELILEATGEPIFGCDICQTACPYNAGVPTGALGLEPQVEAPIRSEYIALTNDEFYERYRGTPIVRGVSRGWRGYA